jgi:hypothetical protein
MKLFPTPTEPTPASSQRRRSRVTLAAGILAALLAVFTPTQLRADQGADEQRRGGGQRGQRGQRGEQPAPQGEVVVPANLNDLLAKPDHEMRIVGSRYNSDRGALNRTYALPASPTRYARLTRFHKEWTIALKKIDPAKLSSDEARAELKRLQETIQHNQDELDAQVKTQAEIGPLVPFALTIVDLEEARRRVEHMDARKIAGVVNDLKKQVEQSRKALTSSGVNPALAGRAAEAVDALRNNLTSWHRFYDGYDPLFTWWMAMPYKEADQALQYYAKDLREKAKAEPSDAPPPEAKPGAAAAANPLILAAARAVPMSSEPDVPNLHELMTLSQSELRTIYQRYQADRGRAGDAPARGGDAQPDQPTDRTARLTKFHKDWLAALDTLDFDKLSGEGRVDYVLIKNFAQRELAQLAAGGGGGGRGGRGGGGRGPIGRDGLIAALRGEMIAYTPEELIAIAESEFEWCASEYRRAAHEMGLGGDWRAAVEKAKTAIVEPGGQPEMIKMLADEAIAYLRKHDLITVPQVAVETWGMNMMSPSRQLVNPFFTGGASISVSYPTNTMAHEAKLQSMRGNNLHFSRSTVHHELIPGHNLQGFMRQRFPSHRSTGTPFWGEGWALYWELLLYSRNFPATPEDRVGFLFWRSHRCARIIFSLNYHLGNWTQERCIDYLVERVGHERDNAAGEVNRSFNTSYGPLYQAAYLLGGLQLRELHKTFVDSGQMSEKAFHDRIIRNGPMPIAMVRAVVTGEKLTKDFDLEWRFYGPDPNKKMIGDEQR